MFQKKVVREDQINKSLSKIVPFMI